MATYAGKDSSFYATTGGKPVEGAYYSGQRYMGGQLLAPGEDTPGHRISNEVIGQTNPNNVQYISDLRGEVNLGLPSGGGGSSGPGVQAEVDAAKQALQDSLAQQKAETDKRLAELRAVEKDTLNKEQELSTPFRQDLETAQRESLHINENFEANQKLVGELDTLLTQGNEAIKQQQSVTGLAAVRNPRVQQTINDVTARAGVIQAVMNARNSQISVAENMIDRSVNAINADRQDQLTYYNTVLELNRQDILSLDKESQDLATQQTDILRNDLSRAQETADYIKKLLVDPATAQLMGDAGVTLNDSVQQINAKIQQASYVKEIADLSNNVTADGAVAVLSPAGVPADRLITLTDSRGVKHYYQAKADKVSGGSASKTDYADSLKSDAASGMTLSQIFAIYSGYLTADEIYQLYNASSKYGPDKGNVANLAKYGVTQPKSSTSSNPNADDNGNGIPNWLENLPK